MNKIRFINLKFLATLAIIIVPSLSTGSALEEENNIGSEALTICTEPRPQVCTREYRPVCAQMEDGRFKTYSNGCTSCTDPNVAGYRDGECE